MTLYNNRNYEKYLHVIAAYSNGNQHAVESAGFSRDIIHAIQQILNNYSSDGVIYLYELIAASLVTHAPVKALLRLDIFLEALKTASADLTVSEEMRIILSRIFASSGALSGRLNADPSLLNMLADLDGTLTYHPDREYYLDSLTSTPAGNAAPDERKQAIHRAHTVHLMRICARNADPDIPVAVINRELTLLAEATIESCLGLVFRELTDRLGSMPRQHSLVVLGAGKLGGAELNVSSDIDLIYLSGGAEESWGKYDSLSFHTMLAERLTRVLSEATELGMLYRVDTRLRADGSSGPLVRTHRDYFRYLEMRGEAWERQMLIKARPVAGDQTSGQAFLDSLAHFIYPTSITRSPNREIVELKNRIEARLIAEGSKKTHLKLVPGGIRDIEFVTQCLQLLMGGNHPEVRCAGTREALGALRDLNALSSLEYTVLSDAYTLYRSIENALQWRELLPAFTLPETPEDLDELASFLHNPEQSRPRSSDLTDELNRCRDAVRNIYNEVFTISDTESFEEMTIYAALHPAGDEKAKRFLESLGFSNFPESARTLSRLVFGEGGNAPDPKLHRSSGRFIPKLLSEISNLPDPGGALERFARVTESYKARHTLFDILDSNPSLLEFTLSITNNSGFITETLVNDPSLLDWLVEVGGIIHPVDMKKMARELKRIDSESTSDETFTQSCLALKNREFLRIGARDITGLAATEKTFAELSKIAECIVKTVHARARSTMRFGQHVPRDYSFSVMAAGRLGAGMMDFGSDLDLIYVYRNPPEKTGTFDAPRFSITLAQHMQSYITGGGGPYKIYDVDSRLRPEGGSSVLAVSIDEYKRYLRHRASPWERLALARARAVAGSARLGSEVTGMLHSFIYYGCFTREEVKKIIDIRAAMIRSTQKRYPGQVNVKSGPGGLVDIDFVAQAYAAHYGADIHSLRCRETPRILTALASAHILSRHDVTTMKRLYAFLCNVEKALRIGSGRSVNTLPKSEVESARVARLLGFTNMRRFMKRLEDVMYLTQNLYDRLMNELLMRSEDGKAQA